MTRYLRTDQPELVEWNKTGQGAHTRYGLDGKPIATGQLGDPAGVLIAVDDSPVAAALWDAHDQRLKLSQFRSDATRLSNELAHAKAIANGVQNALRDQLGEARADRDKVIDQMLTQHREFWNDAVDIRTTSELMKIEGVRAQKARDEYRERLDEIGRMLVDTAGNLGLTIADGAAPEQIAHQIVNRATQVLTDRNTLESKYDDLLGSWRKAEARVEQLKAANNALQNLTSRVTSDGRAEQAADDEAPVAHY